MENKQLSNGSIKITSNNKCGVVYVSGAFAFNLQSEFRQAYEELTKKNSLIQVDFQQVNYMDSSGLGMLLVMKKFLDSRKITFELLRASGQVQDLLKLTHFEKYFKINGQAING